MSDYDDDYDDDDEWDGYDGDDDDEDERENEIDKRARPPLPYPHPSSEQSHHRIACTVPEYEGATFTCIRHCPGCMTTLMAKVLKDERQMVVMVGSDRRVLGLDLIRKRSNEFDPRLVMFERTLERVRAEREGRL